METLKLLVVINGKKQNKYNKLLTVYHFGGILFFSKEELTMENDVQDRIKTLQKRVNIIEDAIYMLQKLSDDASIELVELINKKGSN